MAPSGAITGIVTDTQRRVRREIAARTGTAFVDRAANLAPDLAIQRHATRRSLIGAAHAYQRRGQRNRHRRRNARNIGRGQIGTMKIDAEGGTTGAATEAGEIRHGRNEVEEKILIVTHLPHDGKHFRHSKRQPGAI